MTGAVAIHSCVLVAGRLGRGKGVVGVHGEWDMDPGNSVIVYAGLCALQHQFETTRRQFLKNEHVETLARCRMVSGPIRAQRSETGGV